MQNCMIISHMFLDDNVLAILPLMQEYQIDSLRDKCEEHLLSQANSIKNLLIAQKFSLDKLLDANMSYLKRAPVSRYAYKL